MHHDEQQIPNDVKAKLALAEAARFRKLYSEVPKSPLYFLSFLVVPLVIGIQRFGDESWAKPLVYSITIAMATNLIAYVALIVNKVNAVLNHLQGRDIQ